MANIRSISITEKQDKWLDEHTHVSLSNICQAAIEKAIDLENSSATHKENAALRERLASVAEQLRLRCQFIDKKGLSTEYFENVLA